MGSGGSTLTRMNLLSTLFLCFILEVQSNPTSCKSIRKSFCIGDHFYFAAAHGTHSMTLQELKYFFDAAATANNNIPIVNFDLSSQLLLSSAPDLHLNNSFSTPMMHSVDHILSNWENENFFVKGASVLELLVHNMHMYETLSVSAKVYKQIKQKREMRRGVKKLCSCLKEDDHKIESRLKEMAQYFRSDWKHNKDKSMIKVGRRRQGYVEDRHHQLNQMLKNQPQIKTPAADEKCSNFMSSFNPNDSPPHVDSNTGVPPLVNSTMWDIWKRQLIFGSDAQWNYDLAYYLYCKLNQN